MIINSSISKKIVYLFFVLTITTITTITTYRLNAIETIFVTNEYSEYLLNKMYGIKNSVNILNINKDILFTPIIPTNPNLLPNKDAIFIFNKDKFDFVANKNESKNEINNDYLINLSEFLDKKNVIINTKKAISQSPKKIDSLNNVNTKKDIKNPKVVKSLDVNKSQNDNINPNYWLSINATINIIDSLSIKISSLDSVANNSILKNSELIKKRLNLLLKEVDKYSKLRKTYLLKSNYNRSLILSINGKADYYLSNLGVKFSKYEIEVESSTDNNKSKLVNKIKQNNEINQFNNSKPNSLKVIKDTVKNTINNINTSINSNIYSSSYYEKVRFDLNISKAEVIVYFTENPKTDLNLIKLIENVSDELKIQYIIIDLNEYKKDNENNRGFDYIDFMKWLSLKV